MDVEVQTVVVLGPIGGYWGAYKVVMHSVPAASVIVDMVGRVEGLNVISVGVFALATLFHHSSVGRT